MKRFIALAPLIALLIVVAMSAFLLLRGGDRETFAPGLLGRPAPAYSLSRLGGGDAVIGDSMRGQAYVINIFASWCTPCRVEHSQLMALEARGVRIVGIAYKDDPADAQAFLAELGDPFVMVGLDPDGRLGLELGITGAPETFVIDAAGMVRSVHRGALTDQAIETTILPALEPR